MTFAATLVGLLRAAVFGGALVALAACQTTSATGRGKASGADNLQEALLQSANEAVIVNNYAAAAGAYARLVEQRPDDPAVMAGFIRYMRYADRAGEVVAFVDAQGADAIADPGVRFEYAKAMLSAGRASEALSRLRELMDVAAEDWRLHSALGVAHDALGDFERAGQAYVQALRLSPDNAVVLNNLAMSQAMAGDIDAAVASLEKAAALDRKRANIRQNLALMYAIKGDVERARTLSAMDLDAGEVDANLSFYRRFEGARP
ncbi:MAG: tetratricopeptide repeat protein [Alphaproteobacteria bacterium]|nr:tetratricopeptide repeat protein [Alphaproteobacteria bacterium]MBF0250020.1 tetratricopeptide repeat protein [Alphaproteobacteria bacterium]